MMKDKDGIPEKEQMDFQQEFEILQVEHCEFRWCLVCVNFLNLKLKIIFNILELIPSKHCGSKRCSQ